LTGKRTQKAQNVTDKTTKRVGQPNTPRKLANRRFFVPPLVCDVLRWHADKQRIERRQAEVTGECEDHGTVFATPYGRLYFRSQPETVFRQVADELGIEHATPHTFRHTVLTRVQEAGNSMKDAQALAGHTTERMTLRVYSHPSEAGMRRIADGMQEMLVKLDPTITGDVLAAPDDPWNTLNGTLMGQTVTETA
jgi:integrase